MGTLTTPPSGPTYLPSMVTNVEDWWTSLRADFRVKTCPPPGSGLALMESGAASGGRCLESFGKWDRDSSSLKTYQASLWTGKPEPWSGSFPPSGMTANGVFYLLKPLVPRTSVGAGGTLPTPRVTDVNADRILMQTNTGSIVRTNKDGTGKAGPQLADMAKTGLWPTPNVPSGGRTTWHAEKVQLGLEQSVRMWPTPKGSPEHYGQPRDQDRGDLQAAALTWPTPTNSMVTMGDLEQARFSGNDPRRPEYKDASKMFPTLRGQDSKHSSPTEWERENRPANYLLHTTVGGQLNPGFVEWLMGVPRGWTDLTPLPAESWDRWQQGDHWQDGEWPGVPRVATGVKDRAARLRALGNGIVPACVARFLSQ